jgi:hypothetical protein
VRAEDHPPRQLNSIHLDRAITGRADCGEGFGGRATQYHLARLFLRVERD